MRRNHWKYRAAVTALTAAVSAVVAFPAGAGNVYHVGAENLTVTQPAEETEAAQTEAAQNEAAQNEAAETEAAEAAGTNEETTAAVPVAEVTEDMVDAYFDGTVLVGDSIMLGFRNYAMNRSTTFLGRLDFLAAGSFSVENALWPVSSKSVHPVYQGQKRLIWESIAMMHAKRVYLFFGMNDMNMNGPVGTVEKYKQLIANILQYSPDAEIHIMGMTYTLAGKGKGQLNNNNIRLFNQLLQQMCLENGWGFIDMANPLADANGDLAPAYCSDNYVHETTAAYDVWTGLLRADARAQLEGTNAFPIRTPIRTAEVANQ